MSRTTRHEQKSLSDRSVTAVTEIIGANKSSFVSADIATQAIGVESLDTNDFNDFNLTYGAVIQQLENSPIGLELLSNIPESQRAVGLEAAAYSLMAAGDLKGHHMSMAEPATIESGGVLVSVADTGNRYSEVVGVEAFDAASLDNYVASNVYANAQAAIVSDFEDAFYPTVIVPAGQNGVQMDISVPKLFHGVIRDTAGNLTQFKKISILEGYRDSSILQGESTAVIPYAVDATTPVALVPDAVVPTTQRVIDGLTIDTRPLLFGTEVDVIGISSAPGLIGSGAFDETDSLDHVMTIGKVYYELVIDPAGANLAYRLEADMTNVSGSLLSRTQSGNDQDFAANFTAQVVINQDTVPVSGAAGFITQIESALTIATGTDFTIVVDIAISANANRERSNFVAYVNKVAAVRQYDANKVEIGLSTQFDSFITLAGIGYFPNLNRTNSNLRPAGTIVDSTERVRYTFPVPLGAPLISHSPIGSPVNTTVAGLAHVNKLRTSGNAVRALFTARDLLKNDNGIPGNSSMVGAELVTPTYYKIQSDVTAVALSGGGTKEALDDLRGQLSAAVANAADVALQQSGILAAIELETGSNDNFEVILVTSPHIANNLYESGDSRTFGARNNFVITSHLDRQFEGKIIGSFRRKERNGLSPLDAGFTAVTPALVHDRDVARGDKTIKETRYVPRSVVYHTLPIIFEIEVVGLEAVFSS